MVLDALIWIKNKVDSTLTLPPLVPRGHLRLVRHEHGRHELARLHADSFPNLATPATVYPLGEYEDHQGPRSRP